MNNFLKILTFGSMGLLFLLIAGVATVLRPSKTPKVTIGLVEFNVEVAESPLDWERGLIGHQPLKPGEGIFFIFPAEMARIFWMKNMSFAIDIIWINNGQVVGFVDDAKPDDGETTYSSPGNIDRVLEIAAGERARLGITAGAPVNLIE